MKWGLQLLAFVLGVNVACSALAQTPSTLLELQHRWANANYELNGDAKEAAFDQLVNDVKKLVVAEPDNLNYLVWQGIIQSSAAGAKGGLGALSLAKDAKASFEAVLSKAPDTLDGSAITSLGVLYHKVPGWPIAFGSDKQARRLLSKALEYNPYGIDSNYFYAEFLYDEGDYSEARKYLELAKAAAPRPERPLADSGRRQEIAALSSKLEKKH